MIPRVAVYTLPLGLTPADAPRRVPSGRGEGDDMPDVPWGRTEGPFEDGHASHGAAYHYGDGGDG